MLFVVVVAVVMVGGGVFVVLLTLLLLLLLLSVSRVSSKTPQSLSVSMLTLMQFMDLLQVAQQYFRKTLQKPCPFIGFLKILPDALLSNFEYNIAQRNCTTLSSNYLLAVLFLSVAFHYKRYTRNYSIVLPEESSQNLVFP